MILQPQKYKQEEQRRTDQCFCLCSVLVRDYVLCANVHKFVLDLLHCYNEGFLKEYIYRLNTVMTIITDKIVFRKTLFFFLCSCNIHNNNKYTVMKKQQRNINLSESTRELQTPV